MKHIFYFIGMLFVIYEMFWILNPTAQIERSKRFNDLTDKNKGKKWEEYPEELKDLWKTKGVFMVLILLWQFSGLLTFNWMAFLIFIPSSIVIGLMLKPFKYGVFYTIGHWFSSLYGFAFGVFVILNSYHLKIDLLEYIRAMLA